MNATPAQVEICETIIQKTFQDKDILHEALQTAGIGRIPKNTRLAVYGDAALNKMLCRQWYDRKGLNKGDYASGQYSMLCLSL
jgi:hypothetical protein